MQYAVRIRQDVKAENGFNTMKKFDFNFWQDHSDHYLKMAFDYERNERIKTLMATEREPVIAAIL